MTHLGAAFARLARSRRIAVGVTLLGLLALVAVFSEVLAAPAPIFAVGPSGVRAFPAVVDGARYAELGERDVARAHAGDAAVWPLVRFGPGTAAEAGALAPSSRAHPLGTDARGHDLFARLVYGARSALGLSLAAVLASLVLGVALGALAGEGRGFWNDRLARLVETVDTFPAIIVVALVRAIEREPSVLSLVIAVSVVRWAEVARLVRAESLRAQSEEYVTAARALGASRWRVFFRHVLPNAVGPVFVSSVFGVASIVLLECAISFLEMGAPTDVPTWGETLAEGARSPEHVRLLLLPGLLVLVTVGASYLIADALRDAFDARTTRGGLAARPR
ncbi:MAG TPA: ABC transporter permease [Byssovorax sp.]